MLIDIDELTILKIKNRINTLKEDGDEYFKAGAVEAYRYNLSQALSMEEVLNMLRIKEAVLGDSK